MPIGVFDSGVGGLTVVATLARRLPQESILYLGDTARLPYGDKSPRTVRRYTRRNIDFLLSRGVKAVVVACNTASALALDELDLPVPVWGVVEPGAATAVDATRGRVGVIATESTIRSDAYGRAIRRLDPEIEVLSRACPLFVPLVEEGWSDDSISRQIAERYLEPLLEARIDTLVLGCTHYPLLKPVLRQVVGAETRLVDSAEAVTREVDRELASRRLATGNGEVVHHFCVTDSGAHFERVARDLLAHVPPPDDLDTPDETAASETAAPEPATVPGVRLELVEV
ncbi:MAG: glutamate racemase [bacterium]|nr:glutamate racemase [bacterium]